MLVVELFVVVAVGGICLKMDVAAGKLYSQLYNLWVNDYVVVLKVELDSPLL